MKLLAGIFMVLALISVVGCSKVTETGNPTPIPNEMLELDDTRQDLPIDVAYPQDSGDEAAPTASGDGVSTTPSIPPVITATPTKIYTLDGEEVDENRTLVTVTGLAPTSMAHVWGYVFNDDSLVESPPKIDREDEDPNTPKIQMTTSEGGGLAFWVIAGEASGSLYIKVSDGIYSVSTLIEIVE